MSEVLSGSAIFYRMRTFEYGDDDRAELMLRVWSGTPWIVNVQIGSIRDQQERPIIEWCQAHLGDEAQPLRDMPGNWRRGNATVFGWTWFGFSTEAAMHQFMEAWPRSTEDEL